MFNRMKRLHYFGIGLVVVLLALIVPNYFDGNVSASGGEISGNIVRVEVIHFHATSQCASCIAVGDLARETVYGYFSEEVGEGLVSFEQLNLEWPVNLEKVEQYGVTGSSLWIGVYYDDGSFVAEENVNVWYKVNDRNGYLNYLKGIIEEKLG